MFVQFKPKQVSLKSLNTSVYIDFSGSTGGSIMKSQLAMYQTIKTKLNVTKLVKWDECAYQIPVETTSINSNGGTDPRCFLKYWSNEQLAIIFTDGEINVDTMKSFKLDLLAKCKPVPIILVLTIGSIGANKISDIQRKINMSIPESFLSLSNDVLILLADGIMVRTLMSKGCFAEKFPGPKLSPELMIAFETPTDLNLLETVIVDQELPSNLIKLPSNPNYFDLNSLVSIEFDIGLDLEHLDLIEELCSRALLPRLDLGFIHRVLDRFSKKTNSNPALDLIRTQLYQAATNPEIAGTQAHKDLVELYAKTKISTKSEKNRMLLGRINKLKQIIREYQTDSTSFTYGSNRAIKASDVSEESLDQIGECVQVECPIYITEGPGCIVFKQPIALENTNFVTEYTSDYWLESPFELGAELIKWVGPGIYCKEMVERMDKNPFTMEPVIGWIPLTSDPSIAMAHMSKVFGGKKQLWHFVRAYCGLLAELADKHWAQDHKDKIVHILRELTKLYNVSEDLKASNKKIPLFNAFDYVVTNYSTCLRDRYYTDVMTILKIIDLIKPELNYPRDKIESMCGVVKVFDSLLRAHKQDHPMLPHVMEVDDWGHYLKYIGGIEGLVGQLLWYDTDGKYKLYKLQIAIEKSFTDKKFGKAIRLAFNGEPWDQSILECALPELEGHELVVDVWVHKDGSTAIGGLDDLTCGYTGKKFESSKDKLDHIKKLLGPYFFNGHSAVKSAIGELGTNADPKAIFTNAKLRLYKAYGQQAKVLHTARAKRMLQLFISKLT